MKELDGVCIIRWAHDDPTLEISQLIAGQQLVLTHGLPLEPVGTIMPSLGKSFGEVRPKRYGEMWRVVQLKSVGCLPSLGKCFGEMLWGNMPGEIWGNMGVVKIKVLKGEQRIFPHISPGTFPQRHSLPLFLSFKFLHT